MTAAPNRSTVTRRIVEASLDRLIASSVVVAPCTDIEWEALVTRFLDRWSGPNSTHYESQLSALLAAAVVRLKAQKHEHRG